MHTTAQLDQQYVWHPFTQMRDWLRAEPLVIVRGEGAVVEDAKGREYLDANSSIWTNLHGHNHPKLNAAIQRQLGQIAHSSALGLANEPASILAANLVAAANQRFSSAPPQAALTKVFYSDNGSTAMEVALKLAYEFSRRTGQSPNPKFLSIDGAYHGDTVGAVSLGHIDRFHRAYSGLLFPTDKVMAPYCYRCPFNRARPERADARDYRQCNWECVGKLEEKLTEQRRAGQPGYSGIVIEPLIQGAAGMVPQPHGWLSRVRDLVRQDGALLIADEVLTGFGRASTPDGTDPALFASHREGVQPDLMALAKGMTGGYLPMAATLTSQAIFDAFLGDYTEFKTFFHGHSYTGNQLGSAAAIESLELLKSAESIAARQTLSTALHQSAAKLWDLPNVGDIRQEGTILAIELVKNRESREPFAPEAQAGIRVCEALIAHGVLTRPIGNVLVVMPPYCTSADQVEQIMVALSKSIQSTFGPAT